MSNGVFIFGFVMLLISGSWLGANGAFGTHGVSVMAAIIIAWFGIGKDSCVKSITNWFYNNLGDIFIALYALFIIGFALLALIAFIPQLFHWGL